MSWWECSRLEPILTPQHGVGVQSSGPRPPTRRKDETIDPIIEDGVRLTLIGVGTAFGLLLMLATLIALMGWAIGRFSRGGSMDIEPEGGGPGLEDRDKALAAVVAITALREGRYGVES